VVLKRIIPPVGVTLVTNVIKLTVSTGHTLPGVEVLTVGEEGVEGCASMTISSDGKEVHPFSSVTVKLYVAAANPDMVELVPEPAKAPGLIVQFPAGKPDNTTLPVGACYINRIRN
jgi:hypothetical protein